MNSTEHLQHRSRLINRLTSWLLLCGLFSLIPLREARAQYFGYTNSGVLNYQGTVAAPPQIDALNFINTGSFTIDFNLATVSADQPFYETSDTTNYVNTGSMAINTGFLFDLSPTTGANPTRTMSGSILNSGTIDCTFNTNEVLNIFINENLVFFGNELSILSGFQGFDGWATNIVNSGTVDVGDGGLLQLTGHNLNLSRGTLLVEGSGANAYGIAAEIGTNVWSPADDLGATFATPPFIDLTDSTPFIVTNSTDNGSNNVIRAIFIQDNSLSNVSYQVYFQAANLGIGTGTATIQWTGTYLDVATGQILTNYLYLNNDYVLGSSTNVLIAGGYPDNFTFFQSSVPINFGVLPTPAGFLNLFNDLAITNRFAYGNIQLISTTEPTNAIANRALTNIVGRIEIGASNELNLANAQISGPNYLSVQSPNQFDGSAGASIGSPFSDLNLGVTNGFLTISNLLIPQVPIWSGTIQAYSSRWLDAANGITNDYRVLVVGSQVSPTTLAQVQYFFLHSTNSTVLSDAMNVMTAVTDDSQNLTLTTNGVGIGSTSLDGELNVQAPTIFWQTSFPYLRNLTNNGAIRLGNVNQFIGISNSLAIVPMTPATAATSTLSEISGRINVLANNGVTIGSSQYIFVSKLTNTIANQVKLASTFDGSLSNLIAAINHASGSGTSYSTNTPTNALVIAGSLASHAFTVTATTNGSAANSIAVSTTSTNLTWNGELTLAGGTNYFAGSTNALSSSVPYYNFINTGLLLDQGSTIWADNFFSSGTISNGIGSFDLDSLTTTLTNGILYAGGDIAITADSLVTSNLTLQTARSLTLQVTNLLTDTGVTNGSIWQVGGAASVGMILPVKPVAGDLLGTTITNFIPFNKNVVSTWAGQDFGASASGYTNNAAIGRLIIEGSTNGVLTFTGTGTSNAIYVDYLELRDQATNLDNHGNPIALTNSSNLVIYYAQAVMDGFSVAELLNHENNDHLRWVPSYAGHFSSTNLYYAGATNTINAALAASQDIDSSGTGVVNGDNKEPVFVSGQVQFGVAVTNVPPLKVRLVWNTIPDATNYVLYTTNLAASDWITLTNFVTPSAPPAPITDIFYDTVTNSAVSKYYRVRVDPNVTDLYGP